jgi:dienelactone hydrolase
MPGVRAVAPRGPGADPRDGQGPVLRAGKRHRRARELVETVGPELATLFVYPGDRHLFADSSLPSYDADAAALVVQRSREFLDRLG